MMQTAYADRVHRPCWYNAPHAGVRCRAAPSLLRHHALQPGPQQVHRRQLQTVRASAPGTGSEDPYKVIHMRTSISAALTQWHHKA